MAKVKKSLLGNVFIESRPKKTRQGSGQHTKYDNQFIFHLVIKYQTNKTVPWSRSLILRP